MKSLNLLRHLEQILCGTIYLNPVKTNDLNTFKHNVKELCLNQ